MADAQHIKPDDLPWESFHDPHGRPTTPTRILRSREPFLIEADFPANFYAGEHWHPHDTIYLITQGEMRIGDEGAFCPGDIRWVKAGHAYGPEEAGEQGVQFHLFSLGGDIGLNWADLYEVPKTLTARLARFEHVAGRRRCDDLPLISPGDPIPQVGAMLDEGPLIFRVQMRERDSAENFALDFEAVWYLRAGSVSVQGVGSIASGEFFCSDAGQSYDLVAGAEGAEWLVFASHAPDRV